MSLNTPWSGFTFFAGQVLPNLSRQGFGGISEYPVEFEKLHYVGTYDGVTPARSLIVAFDKGSRKKISHINVSLFGFEFSERINMFSSPLAGSSKIFCRCVIVRNPMFQLSDKFVCDPLWDLQLRDRANASNLGIDWTAAPANARLFDWTTADIISDTYFTDIGPNNPPCHKIDINMEFPQDDVIWVILTPAYATLYPYSGAGSEESIGVFAGTFNNQSGVNTAFGAMRVFRSIFVAGELC